MWNLSPPPGFVGLRSDKPLTMYERHLPHWRQDGATYFVTFRLYDSLPQSKLRELDALKHEWERKHPPPRTKEVLEQRLRDVSERVEKWLDQGMGRCVLKQTQLAEIVTSAMHHFDDERYELDAYVVMPNHVHGILRPSLPDQYPLENILGSWKSYSSRRINKVLGYSGNVWQEESFDRIIRDEEHLWRATQYVGTNPQRAGLRHESCPMWIRPAWAAAGWTFERRRKSRS